MENMKMEQLFNENGTPMTSELLEQFNGKTYFNGEDIKVGDVIYFAMLINDSVSEEGEMQPLTIIKLNKYHFGMFTFLQREQHTGLTPVLRLK